jgi:hypothetical protein
MLSVGRISGTRDESGAWRLDEAELVRHYGELPVRRYSPHTLTRCWN